MPDDTVLVVRRFAGHSRTGVLIIPDRGCTITKYERLAQSLHATGMNVFLLELRGHGLSEGEWDEHAHEQDIERLLEALRYHRHHGALYLVAEGVSATLLLRRQPAVNGMVLLDPVMRLLPQAHLSIPTRMVIRGGAPEVLKRISGSVSIVTYDGRLQWMQRIQESLLSLQSNATMASPMRHPALRNGIAG